MPPRGLFQNQPELNLQPVRLSYQGLERSANVSELNLNWLVTVLVYVPASTARYEESRYQPVAWQSVPASTQYRRLVD